MTRPPTTAAEIDYTTARAKVADFIATVPKAGKYGWEIRDENMRETDGFWLFSWAARSDFWPNRKWAPTVGNNPIAVRKRDGAMFMYHMLCPWTEFVKRIESNDLDPYGYRIEPK